MLEKSDLIIAQEFLQTDFDWRVGIIDRKAIYVCKYYMAGGHWQIMNWQEKGEDRYGLFETFAVEDVPPIVIETALKAANLIGDGIYGVDLKEAPDGQIYLIEINDNPNIDHGIEDQYLQDELYTKVMEVFLQRMRKAKPVMTSAVAETMKVKA
jgi:glutathione synthase/RimK-type ligase-like ATP-grasp enzyme